MAAPIKSAKYSDTLQKLIDSLRQDEFLQADLQYPLVQEAINHWLGIRRLPSELAEQKFNENYRVLQTFSKLQSLQHACAKEGAPFPLDVFLKDFKPALQEKDKDAGIPSRPSKTEEKAPIDPSTKVVLESALKKPKNSEHRAPTKETSVRFANPPKQVEVLFPVEKPDEDMLNNLLKKPWLSMEPANVAAWWGFQFFIIGIWLSMRLV